MIDKELQKIIESIYEYNDYRTFLQDYFAVKKRIMPTFSQRYFAKKAGFNAHNFCTLVMAGKRNLSMDSIRKIIKGIGLRGKTATYFENLVYLNQATTIEDKDYYFSRLKRTVKKTTFYLLHEEQFFFYEKWYYPVIRELLILKDWNGNYTALAKAVRPPLAVQEAREAVELLEKTGLVKRDACGIYSLADEFVTSAEVPAFIKKKARRDVLMKGIETIESVAPHEKYAAYSTVTMSRGLYNEVRDILDETRHKILELVADDGAADDVYEVVLQMFPVTDLGKKGKKAEADGGDHEA
ncbi:MAG: TIGR02147 family protein [Chitinispirillaceae bacterium]|nr:TIGR02147 family protein [Chitinispirillaceae bacterium]